MTLDECSLVMWLLRRQAVCRDGLLILFVLTWLQGSLLLCRTQNYSVDDGILQMITEKLTFMVKIPYNIIWIKK